MLFAYFWEHFLYMGVPLEAISAQSASKERPPSPPEPATILQAKIEHFGLPAGTTKSEFSRMFDDFGAYFPRSVFDIIFCRF